MMRYAVGFGRWRIRLEKPGGAELELISTELFDNLSDAIDCRYSKWFKDEHDPCIIVVDLFSESTPVIVCLEGHMPGRFFEYYATLSDIIKSALGRIVNSSLAQLARLASKQEKV